MKIDGNRRQDRATELVLNYFAAFNRSDWDGLLALLAEDVAHDLDEGSRQTGRLAFAAYLASRYAHCHEQLRDIVVLATLDGNRAAAEYVIHGHSHDGNAGPSADGAREYPLAGGAFFQIHDDRIARVTHYCHLRQQRAPQAG